MKKYIITNPRYQGEIEVIYNLGVLDAVSFTNTNMNAKQRKIFKDMLPVQEDDLKTTFTSDTAIISASFNITFDEFWKKYNHKFNRDRCEALWKRMTQADIVLAFFGLDKYHRCLRKNPTQIKMHPDTYLRSKAWLNDYR
jgi:hypothetical protein